jgi:hypothetical protein
MKQTPDNTGTSLVSHFSARTIDGRILRSMAVASAVAILFSIPFVQWRVQSGLLLGGLLALLNFHWLSSSTSAALSVAAFGVKPSIGLAHYVLRYAVVAISVLVAVLLDLVSLPATLIGLSSFVAALFFEAFREAYLAIIHREETS